MGKASKRKAERRQGIGGARAELERRRSMRAMAVGAQSALTAIEARDEAARRAIKQWSGGTAVRPAAIPRWTEDSVGERFFSQKWITDAAGSPGLADARLPDPAVLAGNPGHWATAMSALFRGVVLDRVPVNQPVVSEILGMLAPVVLEEVASAADGGTGKKWGLFEELNLPLFMLGGYALIEGAWAILGNDPVGQVLAVLQGRMQDTFAAAENAKRADAKFIAETLLCALTDGYRFDDPGDIDTLKRIGHSTSGNVLLDLIHAKQVGPEDALHLGLVILSALADMARTDERSILSEAPGPAPHYPIESPATGQHEERTMKQWWGGAVQSPAVIPHWAENSVGDRFFSQKWITDAAHASGPADATLPEPDVLADDHAHCAAAMSTLFRGVVLDGVAVDDPQVPEILRMLTPVLREELAQIEEQEEEWGYFEETTGPLFLLGDDALTGGAWAILGDDPVAEVIPLLEQRMLDALAAAGYGNGTDAKVIAETLILAMTEDYGFEEPADVEALERLGRDTSGNVLLDLIDTDRVAPEGALRLGLVILAALANMARTDHESILSA